MAASPPDPNSTRNTNTGSRLRPDPVAPPSMPRWVKILGAIVVILILAFVIVHLAGGGFSGHAPVAEPWMQWL